MEFLQLTHCCGMTKIRPEILEWEESVARLSLKSLVYGRKILICPKGHAIEALLKEYGFKPRLRFGERVVWIGPGRTKSR